MRLLLWIAGKLSMCGADTKSSITGVVIAVFGVALAVIVMEFTLAIVLGFKNGIVEKLTGFEPKISIETAYDTETDTRADLIQKTDFIVDAIHNVCPDANPILSFQQPAILKTEEDFAGIVMQGYQNGYNNEFISNNIVKGSMPDYSSADTENKIVISSALASQLDLDVGSRPMLCFFINENLKVRRAEVVAIYESNFSEYDNTLCFSSISLLQNLWGADSLTATKIEVRDADVKVDESKALADKLQTALIDDYQKEITDELYPVENIQTRGQVYLNWLSLLDTNVVVIFILMALVCGFTLVSSLFILTLEHVPTIGILRSIGASKSFIGKVFVTMAMRMVGLGMIIGNVLGITALLVQQHYNLLKLDPQMYYLRYVPVEINWWWFVLLNICVAVAAWLILVLPAKYAANVSPAQTVRYE